MARRVSFLFVTVMMCNVLVRGQPPMTPEPGAAPVPDPAAASLVATPPTPGATPPTPGATPPTPGATTPPAAAPTSGIPPVQAAPECAQLNPKCKDDLPFVTGETIWWVGKLYTSGSGAAGSAPAAATPATGTPAVPPTDPAKPPCDPPPGVPAVPPAVPPATTTPPAGTSTPPSGTPATPCGDNKCSITSYTADSCQGIKVLISRNEDGSICMKEATFNKATNSVALFKNTWLPADPAKAILKQMFGFFGTADQSGTIKIVDPSPPEIKTSQNVDFVFLGGGEGGEWALFASCCKSVVFVLYTDAAVCAKTTKNFDQAITPLLQPLGIQPTDLKDIPTELTIKVDSFIQAIPPTAAAAGGAPGAAPVSASLTATPAATPAATPSATPPAATPPAATPPAATPPPATPPPP